MSRQLATRYTSFGWQVYYEGGGPPPAALSGLYTSQHIAQKAIDFHNAKKPAPKPKAKANARSKSVDREE